jgi:hypothetical protein
MLPSINQDSVQDTGILAVQVRIHSVGVISDINIHEEQFTK